MGSETNGRETLVIYDFGEASALEISGFTPLRREFDARGMVRFIFTTDPAIADIVDRYRSGVLEGPLRSFRAACNYTARWVREQQRARNGLS